MYYVCSLAHYAYRYRIGIGLQQKIGELVSVENDVLGLTLLNMCRVCECIAEYLSGCSSEEAGSVSSVAL